MWIGPPITKGMMVGLNHLPHQNDDPAQKGHGNEKAAKLAVLHPTERPDPDLRGRHVVVTDPMLATGHSSSAALDIVMAEGPATVVLMCLVAAPEGIEELAERHPSVRIVTASVDSHLNEVGYIVPGLGDAGDRLFGTG